MERRPLGRPGVAGLLRGSHDKGTQGTRLMRPQRLSAFRHAKEPATNPAFRPADNTWTRARSGGSGSRRRRRGAYLSRVCWSLRRNRRGNAADKQ
jgi:hypothetical protein